jgi:hypothetical protein
MVRAVETLDNAIAGGAGIHTWIKVGLWYEFTKEMVAHMQILGYDMMAMEYGTSRFDNEITWWDMRIRPTILRKNPASK